MKHIPSKKENMSLQAYSKDLNGFIQALKQYRFWHVLPQEEISLENSLLFFDVDNNTLLPGGASVRALYDFLNQHNFSYVHTKNSPKSLATLHNKTRLLWTNALLLGEFNGTEARKRLVNEHHAGMHGWKLPSKAALERFAKSSGNPHRCGKAYRLKNADNDECLAWLTSTGGCNVDEEAWNTDANRTSSVFACHTGWDAESVPIGTMLANLAQRGWLLEAASAPNSKFDPSSVYEENVSISKKLSEWVLQGMILRAEGEESATLDPRDFWLPSQLALLDYTPCRLPKLDQTRLTDHEQGVWELWGQEPATLKSMGLVARDPGRDVQRRAVAIDFGTSSTVVAMDSPSGARQLLRIGVRDFYQAAKAQDFENPTVLECVDYPAFAQAWGATAYRPALDWDWIRAAHEARSNFRNGNTRLSSFLPLLKQWALRTKEQCKRLTD